MKNIKAHHCFNVENIAIELDSFSISVDYDGNIILLTKKEVRGKFLHEVFHLLNGETTKINIPLVSSSFDYAQPLDENWLLVSARTDDEDDYIRNATIFDVQGNTLNTFSFGDAIQDVQTTKNSDIWVSYFDENMDSGLNSFNNQGLQTFNYIDFVKQTGNKVPFIADCYALNVTSESTNIYYYDDFPIVKLNNKGFEIFHNVPVEGSHAFAIMNDHVLFSHDYDHKAEVYLYSLLNKNIERFYTLNQEGKSLNYDYAVGRESKLFLIKDKDIFLINLEDILN